MDAVRMLSCAGQEWGDMANLWTQELGKLSQSQESSIKVMAWALSAASHPLVEGQEKAKLSSQNWKGS